MSNISQSEGPQKARAKPYAKQNSKSALGRFVLWGAGLASVAIAAYLAFRTQPVLVDTATVENGPLQVTVDEDGITRIRERYIVSTPLTGRMLRLEFDVGDAVQANATILVRLQPTDPSLLDPRAVAQAQARVNAARRKMDMARADLAKAEVTTGFNEQEMGRARSARESSSISEVEFEEKQLAFQQSQQAAKAARFAVDIAQYELELEEAALTLTQSEPPATETGSSSAVSNNAMELNIRAPIDGRILKIYQESAAVVQTGAPLLEIGDPRDLEIVADVLSRDAVTIQTGDEVILENWGGEVPLIGRVRLVEPSGFTKLSALGVEEQRVNVIIDFQQPTADRQMLGDNFRVDCRVVVWEAENVLRVPTSALFRVERNWHCFVMENRIARRIAIDIGHSNGEHAEVLSDLDKGAVVILYPGDNISDGTLVQQR